MLLNLVIFAFAADGQGSSAETSGASSLRSAPAGPSAEEYPRTTDVLPVHDGSAAPATRAK